jgi:hypothetical protein
MVPEKDNAEEKLGPCTDSDAIRGPTKNAMRVTPTRSDPEAPLRKQARRAQRGIKKRKNPGKDAGCRERRGFCPRLGHALPERDNGNAMQAEQPGKRKRAVPKAVCVVELTGRFRRRRPAQRKRKRRNREIGKGIERRSRNRSAIVVHLRVIQGSCGGIDSFSSPVASLQCRGRLVKMRDGSPGPDGKSGLGCVAEGACRAFERPMILVTAAAAARRRGPSCHAPRRVGIAGRASGRRERQASSARGGRRPRRSAQM